MRHGRPVAELVKLFGGRYQLAAAAGVPAPTIYAAEERERKGRPIAGATVCYRLARAWAQRTKAKDADELAMGRRLAGMDD